MIPCSLGGGEGPPLPGRSPAAPRASAAASAGLTRSRRPGERPVFDLVHHPGNHRERSVPAAGRRVKAGEAASGTLTANRDAPVIHVQPERQTPSPPYCSVSVSEGLREPPATPSGRGPAPSSSTRLPASKAILGSGKLCYGACNRLPGAGRHPPGGIEFSGGPRRSECASRAWHPLGCIDSLVTIIADPGRSGTSRPVSSLHGAASPNSRSRHLAEVPAQDQRRESRPASRRRAAIDHLATEGLSEW